MQYSEAGDARSLFTLGLEDSQELNESFFTRLLRSIKFLENSTPLVSENNPEKDENLTIFRKWLEDLCTHFSKETETFALDDHRLSARLHKLRQLADTLQNYEFLEALYEKNKSGVAKQIEVLFSTSFILFTPDALKNFLEKIDTIDNNLKKLSRHVNLEKYQEIKKNLKQKLFDYLKNWKDSALNNDEEAKIVQHQTFKSTVQIFDAAKNSQLFKKNELIDDFFIQLVYFFEKVCSQIEYAFIQKQFLCGSNLENLFLMIETIRNACPTSFSLTNERYQLLLLNIHAHVDTLKNMTEQLLYELLSKKIHLDAELLPIRYKKLELSVNSFLSISWFQNLTNRTLLDGLFGCVFQYSEDIKRVAESLSLNIHFPENVKKYNSIFLQLKLLDSIFYKAIPQLKDFTSALECAFNKSMDEIWLQYNEIIEALEKDMITRPEQKESMYQDESKHDNFIFSEYRMNQANQKKYLKSLNAKIESLALFSEQAVHFLMLREEDKKSAGFFCKRKKTAEKYLQTLGFPNEKVFIKKVCRIQERLEKLKYERSILLKKTHLQIVNSVPIPIRTAEEHFLEKKVNLPSEFLNKIKRKRPFSLFLQASIIQKMLHFLKQCETIPIISEQASLRLKKIEQLLHDYSKHIYSQMTELFHYLHKENNPIYLIEQSVEILYKRLNELVKIKSYFPDFFLCFFPQILLDWEAKIRMHQLILFDELRILLSRNDTLQFLSKLRLLKACTLLDECVKTEKGGYRALYFQYSEQHFVLSLSLEEIKSWLKKDYFEGVRNKAESLVQGLRVGDSASHTAFEGLQALLSKFINDQIEVLQEQLSSLERDLPFRLVQLILTAFHRIKAFLKCLAPYVENSVLTAIKREEKKLLDHFKIKSLAYQNRLYTIIASDNFLVFERMKDNLEQLYTFIVFLNLSEHNFLENPALFEAQVKVRIQGHFDFYRQTNNLNDYRWHSPKNLLENLKMVIQSEYTMEVYLEAYYELRQTIYRVFQKEFAALELLSCPDRVRRMLDLNRATLNLPSDFRVEFYEMIRTISLFAAETTLPRSPVSLTLARKNPAFF